MQGGGLQPLILLEMKNEVKVNIVGKWSPNSESNGNVYDTEECSPTIVCGAHGGCEPRIKEENVPIGTDFRIRKLTERECFRLMGVREDDIDKLLKAGISKTQLYKLAGNSIVCDVLMAIFDKMFVNTNAEKGQQLSFF